MTLSKASISTHPVSTVRDAIAALADFVPAVIVTDARFDQDSGFRLCRHVRKDPRLAKTRILMISGLNDIRQEPDWFEGAYDDFLQKPFSLKDLTARVKSLIEGSRGK